MRKQTQGLYTIGYSGHTVATFVETLQSKNITALLDIRMTPISRKKGFSKNGLRLALEEVGIGYYHIRPLGSPKELRNQLYADKNYQMFFQSFRQYLLSQESSVHEAAALVAAQQVCLMCVEDHPDLCHRSAVADAIAQVFNKQLVIQHLPSPHEPCAKTVSFARQVRLGDRIAH